MKEKPVNVSILGGAELRTVNSEGEEAFNEKLGGHEMYEAIKAIAAELAKRGYTVFHGGCGGVMRAAAEGAGEHSHAIVTLPKHAKVMDNIGRVINTANFAQSRGSTFLDPCNLSFDGNDVGLALRRHILTRKMDAVIVAPGGTGTINEWPALIGVNARKRGKRIPVFFLGTFWKKTFDALMEIEIIPSSKKAMFSFVERNNDPIENIAIRVWTLLETFFTAE